MFGIDNYTGFVAAAIVLNLTPGADTLYILTRSISQGRRAGLVSVAGIMTGCVIHVLAAAFGLSLVLSTSATAFSLVKWAGALYLTVLGIRTIVAKSPLPALPDGQMAQQPLMPIFRQGVLTNVLNPKVALFFISFLPQFIDPAGTGGPLPFLALGGTFLLTGTIWCLTLNRAAARMTRALRHHPRIGGLMQTLSGLVFIAFGVTMVLGSD